MNFKLFTRVILASLVAISLVGCSSDDVDKIIKEVTGFEKSGEVRVEISGVHDADLFTYKFDYNGTKYNTAYFVSNSEIEDRVCIAATDKFSLSNQTLVNPNDADFGEKEIGFCFLMRSNTTGEYPVPSVYYTNDGGVTIYSGAEETVQIDSVSTHDDGKMLEGSLTYTSEAELGVGVEVKVNFKVTATRTE